MSTLEDKFLALSVLILAGEVELAEKFSMELYHVPGVARLQEGQFEPLVAAKSEGCKGKKGRGSGKRKGRGSGKGKGTKG